jgi:hypothetical protein
VFGTLNAVPALAGKVYSKVPEPAPYPFVTLGSISEFPDDSHGEQGLNSLVTIHVWSKAPTQGEAYDLFAAVDAALDRVALTVSGFTEVQIKHTQHQVIPDPDPDVVHINAQYRVHMTKE